MNNNLNLLQLLFIISILLSSMGVECEQIKIYQKLGDIVPLGGDNLPSLTIDEIRLFSRD